MYICTQILSIKCDLLFVVAVVVVAVGVVVVNRKKGQSDILR